MTLSPWWIKQAKARGGWNDISEVCIRQNINEVSNKGSNKRSIKRSLIYYILVVCNTDSVSGKRSIKRSWEGEIFSNTHVTLSRPHHLQEISNIYFEDICKSSLSSICILRERVIFENPVWAKLGQLAKLASIDQPTCFTQEKKIINGYISRGEYFNILNWSTHLLHEIGKYFNKKNLLHAFSGQAPARLDTKET